MKRITLILSLIGITFMSFGNPVNNGKAENESAVVKKIINKLNLPENLKKRSNSGIIKVEFIINENNDVEIKNISGENLELSNFIKNKFEASKIELNSLEKNTTYFIDINFKIL